MSKNIQVGAWIDGPHPSRDGAGLDAWASLIVKESGIKCPIIVTNPGIKPVHLSRWSDEHLRDAVLALRMAGADEVGVMVWPVAQRRAIQQTLDDVGEIYKVSAPAMERSLVPDFICVDAEGPNNATGWGPAGAEFADDLIDGLERIISRHDDCYLSVTAVPFKRGIRLQDAALLRRSAVKIATPQAYSQFRRDHWSENPFYRVGPIQRRTWETWAPLVEDGHVEAIRMGCAIYNQDHPTGPVGVEALRQAADLCIKLGARRLCYWSWKHMRSASRVHAERRAFLRELSQTLCPEPSEGLGFADALDKLIWGGGEFNAMTRPGATLRDSDVDAGDWRMIRPVGLNVPPEAPHEPDEDKPDDKPDDKQATLTPLACDDDTWGAWCRLRDLATMTPFKYVPGRGAFDPARGVWVIRRRAGSRLGAGADLGHYGFVCSTWTNFVLGVLTRRGEDFTPEGGMPSLFDICRKTGLQPVPGSEGKLRYRGYGEHCQRIAPGVSHLTLRELVDARHELPTFIVAGQASRRGKQWNYHHTVVFVIDHRQEGAPVYRIAADGFRRGGGGFSATPMVYRLCDDVYISSHDERSRLRAFAVVGLDKVSHKPLPVFKLEGAV